MAGALKDLGVEEEASWRSVNLVKLLTRQQRWFECQSAYQGLESLLKDNDVQQLLQVNRYNEILWFSKEGFGELLWWLFVVAVIQISSDPLRPTSDVVKAISRCFSIIGQLKRAEKESGYQLEKLSEAVKE
jgi:hypothetical protein